MPHLENGSETIFPLTPEDMGYIGHQNSLKLVLLYIWWLLWYYTNHIKAIFNAVKNLPDPVRKAPNPNLALASRSKTVFIGKDLPTRLIGERINPTGRKKTCR